MSQLQPAQPGDGVYGLQMWHGVPVLQGTHHCGKQTCGAPAMVAVFGKQTASETAYGRINVCRPHIVACTRDLEDTWICALPSDRALGDWCPHCATRSTDNEGRGHSLVCPIGLSWAENARRAKVEWVVHDRAECEVCQTYLAGVPGPAG